ncbi:ABC transporter ATP-binding protein [Sphaerochaeta sp. PS]|uniref:ABC transporter ATP-binding protein n=1 Tax=Sphaerochaeta sp. PS TaxID=3076336 RepID=UPI0028A33A3C|nr:ABC transporter ATP-binding protein [Sphaerochaeta sp. PS]MDT4763184.1 ABC transporter ATP-binding protein [Sphaerochaeta sp. PS]
MIEIKLENITKKYGNDVVAVDNISLDFAPGSFVCLLGPSGCGKTTTLRMISGLERADKGRITVGGEDFDWPEKRIFVSPENRKLGLVFQSYALWPHMTVEENVEFGLRMKHVQKSDRTKIITESLDLLRMGPYRKRYPSELSGGQQQRVALARMLAVQPSILLLDEPLSNLDAALRLEMRSELKALHERLGSTVVFVTHDQLEAMSLATHVAVMNEGKLEQYDEPMNIYQKPATEFVARFVGNPPMNMLDFGDSGKNAWMYELQKAVAQFYQVKQGPDGVRKIGFRPEVIALQKHSHDGQEPKPGNWYFDGVVKAVLPTGPEQVISIVVDQLQFYVVTPPTKEYENGDRVTLSVPLRSMHAFDKAGLRITQQA